MEYTPKISIIVPVYNVAPYLRQCLDSLVGQTYRNIEIICIDDGSTDGSGEMLNQYAESDARISVFHIEKCRCFIRSKQSTFVCIWRIRHVCRRR